jgi:bifunctional DNase/RNase
MSEHYIEVELREIRIMKNAGEPLFPIVLVEKDGKRAVQIFIGPFELSVLDSTLDGHVSPRPMTHDLIFNILDDLGATLRRVLVVKLEGNTFYGALEIQERDGTIVRVDARPSDSIILATKRNIPIFVEEQVFAATGNLTVENEDDLEPDDVPPEEDEPLEFEDLGEQADEPDFGNEGFDDEEEEDK